jgi:PAS domain S-box-containing protein
MLRKKILQGTAELRKSEYNIRLIINTIPIMAWTFRPDGIVDFANQRWLDYAGEGAIEDPTRIVHPDDFRGVIERWLVNREAGKAFENEMRLLRADGQYRWFLVRTAPLRDEQENLVRWYGVAIDIEDSRRAKETLNQSYEEIRRLTRHLQKVREEERTSIAREIHDELGQQLTGIKMDVAWIDKKTAPEKTTIKSKLKNIISLLDGSNRSVRKILNELRTGILDDDGLLEALEFQGRQFTERTGIPVEFTATETAIKLPEEIATCIFRVYQESLTNIMRYAEANKVLTSLKLVDNLIIVTIRDDGKGFDTLAVENDRSFGILGMKERIAAVHGTFELVSATGKGTSIIISIPYKTQ